MSFRFSRVLILTASVAALPVLGWAQNSMSPDPMVGGAAMFPTENIIQNALNSKDHTTLVAAVKAAGLVQTLEGPGPFTVFAPTNEAFAALPSGTVPALLEPANKAELTKILTYHVVAGKYETADLIAMITKNGGSASLPTVAGPNLTFTETASGGVDVTDDKGDVAQITIGDVNQSNGVIQVVDKVLMP
jgi:uncharacterized surface protein with fasciclin (FAS1) repeats